MKREAPFPLSDHCDGRVFFNPDRAGTRGWADVLRWKFTSRPTPWPPPVTTAGKSLGLPPANGSRATWINHSTFLLQTPQGNFLTDPVFSERCGVFGRIGPRRAHAPGIAFHDLPEIHYVLLSHDHYDHCDLQTLRKLGEAHEPTVFTPLGNRGLLARAGLLRVIELDWWQSHVLAPSARVTVTPAHHWSNRLSGRRCGRLWGGFYLELGATRVFFAGDTAYDKSMHVAISNILGKPDLAMLPIGAYEPRWFMRDQHCNPAEAVQMHLDLRARASVAMHWGAFQLTDEGRDEPAHALARARQSAGLKPEAFRIMEPGESTVVSNNSLDAKDVRTTAVQTSGP